MALARHRGVLTATAVVAAAAGLVTGCTGGLASPPVAACGRGTPASTSRPNIVFVLTDDLSDNLVRFMPHVLGLEKAGTSFSDYTVTDSLCCPSRSSIFTGRFPHDTGVFTNAGPDGGFTVFHRRGEEAATFATALQAAGYRTAMMGKYLNGYVPAGAYGGDRPYVPAGWSEWDVAGNGYREFNYNLNQNHHLVHHGTASSDYLTDVLSGRAVRFIDACHARHPPFLLEVATFAPHRPYVPAPRDRHAFPGLTAPRGPAFNRPPRHAPGWLAALPPLPPKEIAHINRVFRYRVQDDLAVDKMIGAIETALHRAGDGRDTDVFFSSDNGYHLGEYRLTPGKMTAFDTDIRVPLVAAGVGIPAGRVVDAVVANVDLAPTFEALAGLTPPGQVDGRSLVPLLHDQPARDWRTATLVEHHHQTVVTAGPDAENLDVVDPPTYDALHTGSYTYVEYADGSREFYDLARDPLELDNIAAQLSAATLRTLHRDLLALMTCHGATACWAAAHPAPVPTG